MQMSSSKPKRLPSTAVVLSLSRRTADDFARLINDEHRLFQKRGFEFCIRVGNMLETAKAELPRDEFREMVKRKLNISQRYARWFPCIADADFLKADDGQKGKHASVLPEDITAIYYLSRLDAPTFEAAVERGTVHPKMTRADARALIDESKANAPAPKQRGRVALKPAKVSSKHATDLGDCLAAITLRLNDAIFPGENEVMSDEDRRQLWRMIGETWERLESQVAAFKQKQQEENADA